MPSGLEGHGSLANQITCRKTELTTQLYVWSSSLSMDVRHMLQPKKSYDMAPDAWADIEAGTQCWPEQKLVANGCKRWTWH